MSVLQNCKNYSITKCIPTLLYIKLNKSVMYTLFYKQPVYKQPDPGFGKLPEKLSNWTLKPSDIKQLIYTYRHIDNQISAQNVSFYLKFYQNSTEFC